MAALLLLLLFFFFFVLILPFVHSDPHANLVMRNCSQSDVHNNVSQFISNYRKANWEVHKQLLRAVRVGMSVAGERPVGVDMVAQCRRDLNVEDCLICYSAGVGYLSGCLPSVGGRVFMEGCFIRYANYSFSQEIVSDEDTKICGTVRDEGLDYSRLVGQLVHNLIKDAPNSNGFSASKEKTSTKSVFGLAACLATLNPLDCASCLESAAAFALSCLPSTEGQALMAGCALRYDNHNFLNRVISFSTSEYAIFMIMLYCGIVAVISLLAIITGVCIGKIVYFRKNRSAYDNLQGMENSLSLLNNALQFNYLTLEKATGNFSDSNKLGHGGTGEVFKGCLEDGREIAVKRLFRTTNGDLKNEVYVMSLAKHKNLVRFLGFNFNRQNCLLLVYEYLAHKSLDNVLFDPDRKKELDWKRRHGILIGIAEGLEYLHRHCEVKVVHRDIKSYNILLDVKYRPKIADFGLAKLYENDDSASLYTAVQGTLGYMAPEYIAKGQLTEKVDVYSYGVLVLEIVSGVQNNKFKQRDSVDSLVTSTWKHFQANNVSEIIDESMEDKDIEQVKRAIHVGLLCTQEVPSQRPSMTDIIEMLKQKDRHLRMPSKPPFVDESMEISHDHDVTNCSQPSADSSTSKTNTDYMR
ncbi:hypothetical protein Sjap_016154 [Stephania japonica]|uniref:Cysteine-rich receptor-like protein kinase 2 n=1 Tax=Stephania japonica TaxID=461633 RepID=A0AAP0IKT4_9MAGN